MPSEAKVAAVEELSHVLEGAKSIYLTDFTGMPVDMMANLRRKCRESDVEYRVVKDSLTKLAAKRAGFDVVVDYLEGPTGLALGRADELAPARVLIDFAKEHKLPKIKAALVEGRMFSEDGVKTLAALPTREVLLGQVLFGAMAPLIGFRGVLHQVMWKLVATLQAVGESLEKGGEAASEKPADAKPASEEPAESDSKGAAVPDAGEDKKAESADGAKAGSVESGNSEPADGAEAVQSAEGGEVKGAAGAAGDAGAAEEGGEQGDKEGEKKEAP
jgi:large subunit ribosomal protein L10